MGANPINAKDIHARRMANDAAYRQAYPALEDEFRLVDTAMKARVGSLPPQAGGQSGPEQGER